MKDKPAAGQMQNHVSKIKKQRSALFF